jgi:hypothetical protein
VCAYGHWDCGKKGVAKKLGPHPADNLPKMQPQFLRSSALNRGLEAALLHLLSGRQIGAELHRHALFATASSQGNSGDDRRDNDNALDVHVFSPDVFGNRTFSGTGDKRLDQELRSLSKGFPA